MIFYGTRRVALALVVVAGEPRSARRSRKREKK